MRVSQSCTRCLTRLRPSERLLGPSFSIPRTISTLRTTTKWQWQNGAIPSLQSKRSFLSVFGGKRGGAATPPLPSEIASTTTTTTTSDHPTYEHDESSSRILLQPNNLFHIMDKSPSPSMRERAAAIKRTAYCPHPEHLQANSPQHVKYTCDACGVPTYCSEEHWAADFENHLLICDALKEANEDDHDLRSGRFFPEFEYPGGQMDEALINFTNWDTFLYTRDFRAINDPRSLRQVTKLLTYPITIASFLHELSPYSLRNRLTLEGLKSLSALRYTLHPEKTGGGQDIKNIRMSPPPVRLFMLGARAESSLPREVWYQLTYMFPLTSFHLVFIGPESLDGRANEFPLPDRTASNPYGAIVERVSHNMKISTFVEHYHTLHESGTFAPFDPYFDCFVLFHPGLGHPGSSEEWAATLPRLLETKVPVLVTGYTEGDLERDVNWVKEKCSDEFDVLLKPGENRFKSLRWDINDADPTDLSQGNWGVWSFRGKRYEATKKETKPEL